jgi:predicted ribosome quality control (RQC) complex YloA/Tae2 family protein
VLTRLAVEWASTLVGTRLESLRQESGDRFRLRFISEQDHLTLVISLDTSLPWIGEAVRRFDGRHWSPDPFTVTTAHALVGRRLERIDKEPSERSLRLDFGDGQGLAIELAPHHANLVLLGVDGNVVTSARSRRADHERLTPGRPWRARGFSTARLDPFPAEASAIDAELSAGASRGETPAETVRNQFAGIGSTAVELILEEREATGRTLGTVLRSRLDSISRGIADVLIEGPEDPSQAPDKGESLAASLRLLPWRPARAREGRNLFALPRTAETVSLFHEAVEGAARARSRIGTLGAILRARLDRTEAAERKVRESLRSFDDPDRHRRMGEALLAGLRQARRSGKVVVVPDPYDAEGPGIEIPAPPEKSLVQIADDLFRLQRRSRRGLAATDARAKTLAQRRSRLEALLALHSRTRNAAGAATLEAAMRAEGLPVGLAMPTRAARDAARLAGPRLEGVRMITSADGWTILVGRSGPDNDRLTFKIAAPEDLWLHAAGVHGAHVVILNPERRATVPAATIAEAAGLALWFSDARSEGSGDVHWTRRKNVRRARGGTSGMVVLKRFETVRARSAPPPTEG